MGKSGHKELIPLLLQRHSSGISEGISVERRGQLPPRFPKPNVFLTLPLAPCVSKLGWGLVFLGRFAAFGVSCAPIA